MSRRLYEFSASAVGFAARIRRPKQVLIESQAPSALASIGGLSTAKASRCRFFKSNVCFDKAYSYCDGDFQSGAKAAAFTEGNHQENNLPVLTRVGAGVSRVEIVNSVQPKSPRRRLTIKRAAFEMEWSDAREGGESAFRIDPKKLALDKIAIDGAELAVTFAVDLFNEFPTHEALTAAWEGDQEFSRNYGHLFDPGAGKPGRRFPAGRHGATLATVVHKVEWANPKKTAPDVFFEGPNVVRIEGIGRIIFGELLIRPNSRHLAMVRAELGSAYGGDFEAAGGGGQGSEYP
ncbi:MAG: hypothetical protein R2729_21820 [Bryobacteraceae bacterium]